MNIIKKLGPGKNFFFLKKSLLEVTNRMNKASSLGLQLHYNACFTGNNGANGHSGLYHCMCWAVYHRIPCFSGRSSLSLTNKTEASWSYQFLCKKLQWGKLISLIVCSLFMSHERVVGKLWSKEGTYFSKKLSKIRQRVGGYRKHFFIEVSRLLFGLSFEITSESCRKKVGRGWESGKKRSWEGSRVQNASRRRWYVLN